MAGSRFRTRWLRYSRADIDGQRAGVPALTIRRSGRTLASRSGAVNTAIEYRGHDAITNFPMHEYRELLASCERVKPMRQHSGIKVADLVEAPLNTKAKNNDNKPTTSVATLSEHGGGAIALLAEATDALAEMAESKKNDE